MTPALARRIAFWALCGWTASVLFFVLVGGLIFPAHAESPDIAAIAAGILLAGVTVLAITWVTSMVAGPFVLVKLRNRPDTLGVWTTIVLPLSLAAGLSCAIAVPVKWTDKCVEHSAVVPLITTPFYLMGSPSEARVAYVRFADSRACAAHQ